MDFFKDASLNSEKERAGIGCVCIDDKKSETSEYSTFFKIDNIHFAELYAFIDFIVPITVASLPSFRFLMYVLDE